MSCQIVLDSCLALEFPDIVWRKDLLLPQPVLKFPYDKRNFCLEVLDGYNTQICLSWNHVSGATVYLVQWALNSDFNGASVQEALVYAPDTDYCLYTPSEIRQGTTVYWRVIAANTSTGGVSGKSEVRELTYQCNEENQNNQEASACDEYNVGIRVGGPQTMGCCDYATFYAEVTYQCLENTLSNKYVVLDSIEWSTSSKNSLASTKEIPNNIYRIGVNTCFEETSIFQVCCKATFRYVNRIGSPTFECSGCYNVYADCKEESETCTPLSIPEDFADTARSGLKACGEDLSVKECVVCGDCGDDCTLALVNPIPGTTIDVISLYEDKANCYLEYTLDITYPYDALFPYVLIFKGEDKEVLTTPSSETLNYWRFDQAPGEPLTIRVGFKGCVADERSLFKESSGASNLTGSYLFFGYTLECSEGGNKRDNVKVASLSGPVFKVDYLDCPVDDPWPDCREDQDDCLCANGKFELVYQDVSHPLCVDVPLVFDLCGCCSEDNTTGIVKVTLLSAEINEDCSAITPQLKVEWECNSADPPVMGESTFVFDPYNCNTENQVLPTSGTFCESFIDFNSVFELKLVPGSYDKDFNNSSKGDGCICQYSGLKITIDGDTKTLKINSPVTFDLASSCDNNCDGQDVKLVYQILEETVDPDCNTIGYEVLQQVFCDGNLKEAKSLFFTLSCNAPDSKTYDTQANLCDEIVFFENIEEQGGPDVCDCIQQEIDICLEYDTEEDCFEKIKRSNKQWVLTDNDTKQEVTIGGKTFKIQDLYFDGCELTANICYADSTCTFCFDGGTPCEPACLCPVRPRQYVGTITFTDALLQPTEIPITFEIDCETGSYKSDLISFNGPGTLNFKARFEYANDGFYMSGVFDDMSEFTNIPPDNLAADCDLIDASWNAFRIFFNARGQTLSLDYRIDVIVLGTECPECDSIEAIFTVEECSPLKASSVVEVDGQDLSLRIGKDDEQPEELCDCPETEACENKALEARVNIPLGCLLSIETDCKTGSKYISLDLEALVGNINETGLEKNNNGASCPSIGLKACDCDENGNTIFANSIHSVKLLEDIEAGEEGEVELLEEPFKAADASPGEEFTVMAKNPGPGDMSQDGRIYPSCY
jgi:hypothetical protein